MELAFAYGVKDYNENIEAISAGFQEFLVSWAHYGNKVQLKTFDEMGITEALHGVDEMEHYNIVQEVVLDVGYAELFSRYKAVGKNMDRGTYYETLLSRLTKFLDYQIEKFK